ncbi:MAG: phosphoribulokinase [Actinomycetota bacterium]|nr:phosphoribulokinase [Actinomycetota bacterium]
MDTPNVTPIGLRVAGAAGLGSRPMLLGLAGDSASGKSTLSRGIEYILGVDRVGRVCTDDYHRYDRAARAELGVTPLSPEANRMDLMAEHLRALATGKPVTKPVYDHHTGGFGPEETVEPGEIVIVEGLLPLTDRGTRDAIDVAVFLEPDEVLRRRWKLERDVFERGYSAAEVVAELKRREADAAEFIRPQRDFADIIVRFHRREGAEDGPLSARLTVRPTLPYPGLRELVGSLKGRGPEPIRWSTATDRRGPMSVLDIEGDCPPDLGAELEDVIWSYLHPDDRLHRERIGMVRHPEGGEVRSEALALAQLLIVSHLVGALDGAFEL